MAVQYEQIEQALIDTIRDLVGSSLSTLEGTTFPSVIRQRQTGAVPQEKYITIDPITNTDFGGWLRDRQVLDTPTATVHWAAEKTLVYRIYAYGDDTERVLEDLTSLLNITSNRQKIVDAGASVLRINAPTSTPRIFADQYKDNSFIDIFMNAISLAVESNNSYVETVEVDSEFNKC